MPKKKLVVYRRTSRVKLWFQTIDGCCSVPIGIPLIFENGIKSWDLPVALRYQRDREKLCRCKFKWTHTSSCLNISLPVTFETSTLLWHHFHRHPGLYHLAHLPLWLKRSSLQPARHRLATDRSSYCNLKRRCYSNSALISKYQNNQSTVWGWTLKAS